MGSTILLAAVFAASLSTWGCGAARGNLRPFSTDWEDDRGASIARTWQRIGTVPVPDTADLVVGVPAEGDALIGVPLGHAGESLSRWTYAHPLDSRPVVAAHVVVGSGGGETFALEAASGELIWKQPTDGLALVGAGDDGQVTVVTFQRSGHLGSAFIAMGHDGRLIREVETEKALGAPAVVDRLAFIPWAGQYVSVFDILTGEETARVTLREETSRAWTESGSLWFGEVAFTRFDERIREASLGTASTAIVQRRDLPGAPKLMPPGATPLPATANANDKVRLYARPIGAASGAAVEDGRYYATYFRVVMGFDARDGRLAWARAHADDFLSGAAASGGIVLCDQVGKVVSLDAAGGTVVAEAELGRPLRACVVNVDGARMARPSATEPLVAQLEAIVRLDDPMLVSAQRFLLGELAGVADPSATKTLVELASDVRTSPDLLTDARAALARRRNGAEYMEGALTRHYDYLKDFLVPPPVGPIADALGAMHDKGAAPLLVAHLVDPADSEDDVKRAAAALVGLAGPNEIPVLRQFFGMYRASADDDDLAASVVSVGQALLTLHDRAVRNDIETAVRDSMTVGYARDRLGDLLANASPDGSEGAGSDASLDAGAGPIKRAPGATRAVQAAADGGGRSPP